MSLTFEPPSPQGKATDSTNTRINKVFVYLSEPRTVLSTQLGLVAMSDPQQPKLLFSLYWTPSTDGCHRATEKFSFVRLQPMQTVQLLAVLDDSRRTEHNLKLSHEKAFSSSVETLQTEESISVWRLFFQGQPQKVPLSGTALGHISRDHHRTGIILVNTRHHCTSRAIQVSACQAKRLEA